MNDDKVILFQSRSAPEFRFLSNFHLSDFTADSVIWRTVEHYFQAQKAVDSEEKWAIWRAPTPKDAKAMGRKVKIREDWDQVKDKVMYMGVHAKFSQNRELKEALLLTRGFELVEYAPWGDTYWGVGKDLVGQNRLGKILMRVREELS